MKRHIFNGTQTGYLVIEYAYCVASSMVKAGATANSTTGNSRTSMKSGVNCFY